MEILKEVLEEIKPNKKEADEVSRRINQFIKKIKVKNAKVVLGGSGVKGTWLKNAYDADVFVLFDYNKFKDKSDKLSDILGKVLKKKFKISTLHGSRDYFQVKEKDFTFEIVPILGIKDSKKALNITDVSPLHANWVKKRSNEKLRDDIRLLKQFCKANNVYGAESYIQGFSGYMLEILVIYYKGFMGLLKNAVKWKDKEVIDAEKYYKNKQQVMFDLNKSKQQSPIIIIDPVQKERNAGAALSYEKCEKFKEACKRFLNKPSKQFFEKKEITVEELLKNEKGNKLIVLDVTALSGKEDVVGSKLLKCLNHIKTRIEDEGFKVYDHSWKWDKGKKAMFWFYVQKGLLSTYVVLNGPPVFAKYHVKRFKSLYKDTFEKDKKIFAKVKRKFVDVEEFVKEAIKDPYVKERVKKIGMY